MRKPAGQKPGSETKLGPGLCRCRRKVSATICRDRLLLSSFNLPHAYFYGNWRAKVPNILQDERIYRQSERRSRGSGWAPWATASYGKKQRSSNQRAQKVRILLPTKVSRLLPAAPESPSWPACRSLGGGSRLYSISERSVSRLPLLESSSSVSPAWSKHRRQSPLFTRNAVSHRGQSSGSCVIAGSGSVKP